MAEVEPDGRRAPIVKLLLFGLLLVGGYVALARTPLGAHLSREGIRETVAWLSGRPGAPAIFVAAYATATALAVPGTVLTLAGGALFGPVLGTALNFAAANLGANAAFLLARALGRDGVRRLVPTDSKAMEKLDAATRRHGFRGVLALRLIPMVPFNALNFGSGLLALRWRSYALATLVGILPGTAIYTFFADALLQGSAEASRAALVRLLVAGVMVLALSALPALRRRLRDRRARGGAAALLVLAALASFACSRESSAQAPPANAALADHSDWTSALASVARGDRVDYAGLARDPATLRRYLDRLADVDSTAVGRAPRNERLAFWINAYNACMLKRVIDHYPIRKATGLRRIRNAALRRPDDSVWQIEDPFTGRHCRVAGATRSQDDIEHEILRPMGDARIHFAINCAAASCPPLLPRAYEAGALDEQLAGRVRAFVNDPRHFELRAADAGWTLRLNRVLDWFVEDFGGPDGLRRFLAEYVEGAARAAVLAESTALEFLEYDWTLNDASR